MRIVVVGSVNADVFVSVDRLPSVGETIASRESRVLPGGKGANQAIAACRLGADVEFIGCFGDDAFAAMLSSTMTGNGVGISMCSKSDGPSGQALIFSFPSGDNSIVLVGGANRNWPGALSGNACDTIANSDALLLQREIPDWVNIQAARAARSAGVPVILDMGGDSGMPPDELLEDVDIVSPNETELAAMTGLPTTSHADVVAACRSLQTRLRHGLSILVKLGARGSCFFDRRADDPMFQSACRPARLVDTTGAGDTFTAAFAVAHCRRSPIVDCLRFASAAASVCIESLGAIPSLPTLHDTDLRLKRFAERTR
ncbi:Ribokinase [Plasmodiophora brassicae]|uniref:Ribokinase n=1 Tax=Plasmodiophora brassicae TaxID=37360 RepID=A0A0G4IJB6_PLABS|nr:hypothetical protein PBRA_003936 [Plasmodiophora brassicae]SPQ96383.1 unnamed protein product [Plasmodiophora brassicae]